MSNLRISLFGKFQVESQGKPLSNGFDSRKVQELFSYLLAYRNRSHPRETLADLLWGDNSSVQARKYLRQALWQLQSALKSESEENSREVLIVDTEWVSLGSFLIADDFSFIGESGQLTVHSDHLIDLDNIRYHRRHYSLS